MMKRTLALTASALLLAIASARADYVIKDGNGVMRTVKAGQNCGVNIICNETSLVDGLGAFVGTAANPLALSFGTGVKLPDFVSPPTFNLGNVNGAPPSATNPLFVSPANGATFNVNCTSGCSAGGGLSVAFGAAIGANGTPSGFKDGSGNFQALLGDVINGQWVNVKASVPIAVTGTFWQATQPVSGTVAATQSGTWNIGSVTTLPAITGTVTANAGTNLNTSLLALETGGNLAAAATGIGSTNTNLGAPGATACATDNGSCSVNALLQRNNQRITSLITALGTPFQAGGSIGNTAFGISGTLPAFAATPTFNLGTLNGAATAANQTTGNASLSSIDGKTPALGQALAAASVPVVLPSAQITALTPPSSVTVTQSTAANLNATVVGTGTFAVQSSQSGAWTVNPATAGNWALGATGSAVPANASLVGMSQGGNLTALTGTSGNLNVQCANCSGSGVSTADQATFTAGTSLFAGAGGFYQTTATANALTTGQQGLFQVTANRALFTNLRNASGTELGVAAAPLQVSLANTAANATAIKVDGSAVTQPISGTITANLGTLNGAATAANQVLTQAPIAPNTATATKSDLIGIQYNSTQATFTNGQQGSVQGTSRGAIYVATGADAFAVNATLSAETTKVIGTTRNLGNAGAIIDFAGQNASSPANAWLTGCQFNTSPTTITSGNASPIQCANDGSVLVTVKSALGIAQGASLGSLTGSMVMGSVTTSAPTYTTGTVQPISIDTSGNTRITGSVSCSNCSGSGASGTDQGAFTAGTSVFAPAGGFFQTTATSNALTNGQWGAWQMTAQRAGFVNLRNASGTEIGTATTALIVGGKGTAGSADTAVQTVQGIASMTPLLTNPGTATSWGIRAEDTAAADGDLGVGALAIRKATPANTSTADGDYEYLQMSAGRLWTNTLLADGTNAVAVKAASTAAAAADPALVVAISPNNTVPVAQVASTANGATPYKIIATASTNSNLISAGAHNVYSAQLGNNSANIAYLKLYNKATAPTCGTDTPVKTLIIPASTSGAGSNVTINIGASFSLGVGICVTSGIADNDTGAVAASAYAINIDYK